MKNFAYLLIVLSGLGLSTGAHAQASHQPATQPATQPAVGKPVCDYCIRKDGNMMMVIQGHLMTPMTANVTMNDGSMCLTDGTCKRPDGTLVKMKEGQRMTMDGKLTMHSGSLEKHPVKTNAKPNKLK